MENLTSSNKGRIEPRLSLASFSMFLSSSILSSLQTKTKQQRKKKKQQKKTSKKKSYMDTAHKPIGLAKKISFVDKVLEFVDTTNTNMLKEFFWGLLVVWVGLGVLDMARMFYPPTCPEDVTQSKCIGPSIDFDQDFDLALYTYDPAVHSNQPQLVMVKEKISLHESFEEELSIPLFPNTRQNGTLALRALLYPHSKSKTPESMLKQSVRRNPPSNFIFTDVLLTRYLPIALTKKVYLLEELTGGEEKQTGEETMEISEEKEIQEELKSGLKEGEIRTHWKYSATFRIVVDDRRYLPSQIPKDLYASRLTQNGRDFLPMFYPDTLYDRKRQYVPLSPTNTTLSAPFLMKFSSTSVGVARFLAQIENSVNMMEGMGMTEDDTEEVLQLISPDRLYVLALTYIISLLHIVFSFLAFKNEVGFWRGIEDTGGLSRRSIIGRAVSSLIIFLFLIDSKGTSWLVIGTSGVGFVVDAWKVTKVVGIRGQEKEKPSKNEELTNEIDAQGMYYLSLILYPCVFFWALYSLYTRTHKSWWSWLVSSAANGVYAFGFLMMTPQIFINYKMKSVAHMPWRAMTYKAFNTFVDDVFACMIDMPTTHRLATLRDDLVFFVYLYQRMIYPVDKKRANEYGFAYEKGEGEGEGEGKGEEEKEGEKGEGENELGEEEKKNQ